MRETAIMPDEATKPDVIKSARAHRTKARLIEQAIELFARRGIQGVSLRTVMEAAGAKNTAAVAYHFGDREALLRAALDCVIEATSVEMTIEDAAKLGLASPHLADFDKMPAVQAILAQAMLPLLTLPYREPWGADGIKLLARIIMGEAQELAPHLEAKTVTNAIQLVDLVKKVVPDVPGKILRLRIDFAYVNLICGMAAMPYLSTVEQAGLVEMESPGELARQLIDYVAGGITAAPSGV